MIAAVLEMVLPRGQEAETMTELRALFDSTRALPGCVGGGVFQRVGESGTTLYVESWGRVEELEARIRSREYARLLAIMETAPEPPRLTFDFVTETRGLPWVERLRLDSGDASKRSPARIER